MNTKYRTIYSFQVTGKLMEGKTIYMLDKHTVKAICVNDMPVGCFVEVLNGEDSDQIGGRYEFWIKEVEEDAEL